MNSKKISELNSEIQRLTELRNKLIIDQDKNTFSNFLKENDFESVNMITYKKVNKLKKLQFRKEKKFIYDNFCEYIKKNNIDCDLSKRNFNKILKSLNIKPILNCGVNFLLLKRNKLDFIQCELCHRITNKEFYENHLNSSECKKNQKFNNKFEQTIGENIKDIIEKNNIDKLD